jgi:hypothetical protein
MAFWMASSSESFGGWTSTSDTSSWRPCLAPMAVDRAAKPWPEVSRSGSRHLSLLLWLGPWGPSLVVVLGLIERLVAPMALSRACHCWWSRDRSGLKWWLWPGHGRGRVF